MRILSNFSSGYFLSLQVIAACDNQGNDTDKNNLSDKQGKVFTTQISLFNLSSFYKYVRMVVVTTDSVKNHCK
jgi:FlaG/FlaF family flagellin (archaellin)